MTTPDERHEVLLMKAVDGLLSADERRELDAALAAHPELAEELEDFQQIKETTDAMTTRLLQDVHIEPPRPTAATRTALGASFLLMLAGSLVLLGFAGYQFAVDSTVPLIVKAGSATLGLGLLIAFGYTLRVRVRAAGRDPYEEIDQ